MEKQLEKTFHNLTVSHIRMECILKKLQRSDLKNIDSELLEDLLKSWEDFGKEIKSIV